MPQLGQAVKPNYYALYICIASEKLPESAFKIMRISPEVKESRQALRETEASAVEEIMRLKTSHTWEQIGEMYGVSKEAVRVRVVRFRKKAEREIRIE